MSAEDANTGKRRAMKEQPLDSAQAARVDEGVDRAVEVKLWDRGLSVVAVERYALAFKLEYEEAHRRVTAMAERLGIDEQIRQEQKDGAGVREGLSGGRRSRRTPKGSYRESSDRPGEVPDWVTEKQPGEVE